MLLSRLVWHLRSVCWFIWALWSATPYGVSACSSLGHSRVTARKRTAATHYWVYLTSRVCLLFCRLTALRSMYGRNDQHCWERVVRLVACNVIKLAMSWHRDSGRLPFCVTILYLDSANGRTHDLLILIYMFNNISLEGS